MTMSSQKVTDSHLSRMAYLYVRQSSMQQVVNNTESTERQYALKQRAVALGWRLEDVIVVDCDQGKSGASAADREGFQRLVAEVSMGRAGVVLGLEVSRLARNSSDWHRLLEICALSDTLIVDEDGIYNPCDFNDRLLLGLKGTMSEAELHMLRLRLRGGLLNKARRGELKVALPVGLLYDLTSVIARHGYSIFISKVGTVLDQVKDTFYIKDDRQRKIVDPEALAKAMIRLLTDTELAANLGAAGRRLVESEYTVDRMVERTRSAYRELLAGSPSG